MLKHFDFVCSLFIAFNIGTLATNIKTFLKQKIVWTLNACKKS